MMPSAERLQGQSRCEGRDTLKKCFSQYLLERPPQASRQPLGTLIINTAGRPHGSPCPLALSLCAVGSRLRAASSFNPGLCFDLLCVLEFFRSLGLKEENHHFKTTDVGRRVSVGGKEKHL